MKNFLLILSLVFLSIPVFAGGIGYINYDAVVENCHFAKATLKEIETKNNEIQQYLLDKEKEFESLESAVQKKKFEENVKAELQTKERAFNDFRERREEEVYNRIHAVSEKIRLEKGLDAILDMRSVFSGGLDITDEMIKELSNIDNNLAR